MKFILRSYILIMLLFSCKKEEKNRSYNVSGQVTDSLGVGIEGVKIVYNNTKSTLTNSQGYWLITDLNGQNTITPIANQYTFKPSSIEVNATANNLFFQGIFTIRENEKRIFNWFDKQQLPNGLLESVENGNVVSLYDNALATMVFMLRGDFTKAKKIFDFFNGRVSTELTVGVGGFSQFRDKNGVPDNHRWMGDNAWLLIALNNYKNLTGNTTYNHLASKLSAWLMNLQDTDGGLFAGYYPNSSLMNYKVTEGNIDAFNAIDGYSTFHSQLLGFLEKDRWDNVDKNLVAWPTNPAYLYALDLHPWSYSMFNNYPVSALTTAQRYLTTKTATNGTQITGYCFDKDKDTVWPEGTAQMTVAFGIAGMQNEKSFFLKEMEKVLVQSTKYANATGFPYASNPGTSYGSDSLWTGADTKIAISGGAWYLFAKFSFNPFAVGRNKNIPVADMFWNN